MSLILSHSLSKKRIRKFCKNIFSLSAVKHGCNSRLFFTIFTSKFRLSLLLYLVTLDNNSRSSIIFFSFFLRRRKHFTIQRYGSDIKIYPFELHLFHYALHTLIYTFTLRIVIRNMLFHMDSIDR